MANSFVVEISKSENVVFPKICIYCENLNPDDFLKVTTHTIGLHSFLLKFGNFFSANVPICKFCKHKFRFPKWGRFIAGIILMSIGMFLSIYMFGEISAWYKKWIFAGVILITLIPLFIWQLVFPAYFELTAYKDSIVYEFKSENYALEFVNKNNKILNQ